MKRSIASVCAVLLCAAVALAGEKPTPPGQPKTGPGGADYAYAAVKETIIGAGDSQVWLYEPDKPVAKEEPEPKHPVIVFLHGWAAMEPQGYRAWIDHLVRRGSIVVYPRYQASIFTPPETMTDNTVKAIKDALAELKKKEHVQADETKLAIAGHSLGGVIALNVAARAKKDGVPAPLAVMSVEPGDSKDSRTAKRLRTDVKSILGDYSTVPKGTFALIVVGDEDAFVGDRAAKVLWDGVRHLAKDDRDFVTVVSDRRGSPGLNAGHFFPVAPDRKLTGELYNGVDALDYYGTWKLLDGLTDAAFCGKNRKYALGNTPEQRFMGKWSDGVPVKELKVLEK